MPWTSRIDQSAKLIYTRVSGALTFGDAVAHRALLATDRGFDPTYSHVLDLRAVDRVDLTADDLKHLAANSILTAPAVQAIIVPNDALFGLGRMYDAYSFKRPQHEDIHVCRTLIDACARLGIDQLQGHEDQ